MQSKNDRNFWKFTRNKFAITTNTDIRSIQG